MAIGLASTVADFILDALCSSVAWAEPAAFYVKLHTGDPGAAGAANAAANTTRHTTTFAPAAAGAITTTGDLSWVNVPAAETYSHVSFWDTIGPAGGNFLGSDDLAVARTVAIGDNFTIATGDLDISIIPIAA
jgi:hypothetical protein